MEPSSNFLNYINLASERLGARSLVCSDDYFAPMENLLKEGRGVFIPDKYTDRGKWMDGWESRRKRTTGLDWCVIALAKPGIIRGIDVDTNHFLGNHPAHCSIEVCLTQDDQLDKSEWIEILPKTSLNPGSQHLFHIEHNLICSHLRLNIFPDGGVARLKVYGEVKKDWSQVSENELIDLAAAVNGGKSILCNDMFFSHMDNLIMPGRGINMGDGWETKRNRTPGNRDWVVIHLAHKGKIRKIEVDTAHFKGNYPDACMIEGAYSKSGGIEGIEWKTVLPKSKLGSDQIHTYVDEITSKQSFTHIRLSIFPDGGISRLRIWGHIDKSIPIEELNQLPGCEAGELLFSCCGSKTWMNHMLIRMPFRDRNAILVAADESWASCTTEDALEAFDQHPKIGDRDKIAQKFAKTKAWASDEQKGVSGASIEVIDRLAAGNKAYESKFGYIFIVCASGKTAEEMLQQLDSRLLNSPEQEIQIAMAEQHKITKLRIEKLIS